MRWIAQLRGREAGAGLAWCRGFLDDFETSDLEWIRIDLGRGQYEGVYGRCWYPSEDRPTFRISCQVPGPFPCDILTRKPPLYRRPDGTFPRAPRGSRRGIHVHDERRGRQWYRVISQTRVETLDEGIVWILAHDAFHFLRKTRQVPGRNNEIEADRFADAKLEGFRESSVRIVSSRLNDQLILPFSH